MIQKDELCCFWVLSWRNRCHAVLVAAPRNQREVRYAVAGAVLGKEHALQPNGCLELLTKIRGRPGQL